MSERVDGRTFDRSRPGLARRNFLRLAAAAGAAGPLLTPGLDRVVWGQQPKKGGTLTVGINTDIVSLDPNDIVFANVPMFFQLYDYLVTFGTNLEPQPSLAESWELAKDGTSATFKLRENVRTHSGGAFDADALIANFQRVKDKATGGGLFSRLEDFTAADKLDARTVRFRFARPRPDFLAMVSRWGMVDPAAFPAVKQKGGGTGPFKLGEWVPGDHLTFVRNDSYWQAGLPYLDRVVFRVLSDAGAMENAFRAGQIDVAHTIPNKDVQRLRAEGLQVQPAPVPNEYYVVILNTRKPPFDNLQGPAGDAVPARSRDHCEDDPGRHRQGAGAGGGAGDAGLRLRSSTRSSPSTRRRPGSSWRRRDSRERRSRWPGSCPRAPRRAPRSPRSSRETSRRWVST